MDKIKELNEQRIKAAQRANALRDSVKAGEAWTTEQRENFDALVNECNHIDEQLAGLEADKKRMAQDFVSEMAEAVQPQKSEKPVDSDAAFRGWLLSASGQATAEQRDAMQRAGIQPGQQSLKMQTGEKRAQSVGTDADGGYTVPDEMMAAIDRQMAHFGNIAAISRVINTASGADLPIPTSETESAASLISENAAISSVDTTFGSLTLNSYTYASICLLSNQMMQDSSLNVAGFVGDVIGERLARAYNAAYTTGTGSSQPQGYVTGASDSGVTTSGAAALTYDNLVDIYHSLDVAYRQNATWCMHDDWVKACRKVKDDQNSPLWSPSLVAGAPDTLFGAPIVTNNDMASATASKVIVIGDFSRFVIRDVAGLELRLLTERFADSFQTAFLSAKRTDSGVLQSSAFKYATSA